MLKSPENSETPTAALATTKVDSFDGSLATVDRLLRLLAAEAGLPAYGALEIPWRIMLR
jgi:hypothetical protein